MNTDTDLRAVWEWDKEIGQFAAQLKLAGLLFLAGADLIVMAVCGLT